MEITQDVVDALLRGEQPYMDRRIEWVIGNEDAARGDALLYNLRCYLTVARIKHEAKDQNKTQLMNDFLEEVEELKGAFEGAHDHSIESEIMDCMTVLVRLWNKEYNKETSKAEGHEWVREMRV